MNENYAGNYRTCREARLKLESMQMSVDRLYRDDVTWLDIDHIGSLFMATTSVLEALASALKAQEDLNESKMEG